MAALSPEAQSRLDGYLKQIRSALTGRPAIDADEVERDVLGHIDAELSGAPQPISAGRLLEVLDRLGAPQEWVPDDEPAWRVPFSTLSSAQGDWRLAGLTFFLFLGGPLLFLSPRMLWPLPPVLMIASFIVARVALALLDERAEAPGARRWLIYPALLPWYIAATVLLVTGPSLPLVIFASEDSAIQARVTQLVGPQMWRIIAAAIALVVGIWWTLVGLLLAQVPNAVRATFLPFAGWFERRHGLRMALTGFVLAAASAALLIAMRLRR